MSRGIKYVREGYAEGGRIPVYGREGDIAYYIDAPPATSQSQPIASFASPVTQGTLTMPGPGPGVYAGHYVPGRTDRTFSPFGFADYTRGSQTNPFAQLVGLRSPEFIPIQSTLGRGYESIYGANLPEGRFDVSADPGVSVTPLTTEEKVNYLRQIAAATAPVTNISNVAYGGAGGTGGAGGSTGPVTATGGTSSATGGAGGSTGPVTATGGAGGTSSVGNVSGGTSSVGNVTGGTSSVGNVAGGSATLGDVVNTAAGGTSTATGTGGTSTATGTGGTPSPITTSLPTPAYEYGGRTYSSYADLLKAIDDDVAARRAQQSATLSDLGRGSEADSGGVLRDIDLPGDVRSDLPSAGGTQTVAREVFGTASTDPEDALGLFEGDRSVTSGELTPTEADLRTYESIEREQMEEAGTQEPRGKLPAINLPTLPLGMGFPTVGQALDLGDELLSGGSGEQGLAQGAATQPTGYTSTPAGLTAVESAQPQTSRGEIALEGLGRAIGMALPSALSSTGPVNVFTGVMGSALREAMIEDGILGRGERVPTEVRNAINLALNPVSGLVSLSGLTGPMSGALQADFNKETARLALSAARNVMSGGMTPEQAAYGAMTDANTAGRLGDVLSAIDKAAEVAGVGAPAGYTSGGTFGAGNLGQDIHSFDPGQIPGTPIDTTGISFPGQRDQSVRSEALGTPEAMSEASREAMNAAADFGGQFGGYNFARGGPVNMSHLVDHIKRQVRKDLARGGYVPGHSGGMDDDVPAVIDGRRPARLSSGEFVFDAATVAALGDGNNAAGAKKLNQLRHAIRQKAYGHRRQPPKNYSLGDLVGMA